MTGTVAQRDTAFPGHGVPRAPDPATPWWRDEEGRRHSLHSLRAELSAEVRCDLAKRHVEAIAAIVSASIKAAELREHSEARRLAHAASRLCEESVGHWPPSALQIPRH